MFKFPFNLYGKAKKLSDGGKPDLDVAKAVLNNKSHSDRAVKWANKIIDNDDDNVE